MHEPNRFFAGQCVVKETMSLLCLEKGQGPHPEQSWRAEEKEHTRRNTRHLSWPTRNFVREAQQRSARPNFPHRHIRLTRHHRECTGTNTEDRSHCSRCMTTRIRFSVIAYSYSVSGITRRKVSEVPLTKKKPDVPGEHRARRSSTVSLRASCAPRRDIAEPGPDRATTWNNPVGNPTPGSSGLQPRGRCLPLR